MKNSFKIYKYSNEAGHEYIIMTEDEDFSVEDNMRPKYTFDRVIEVFTNDPNYDLLPMDFELDTD
jgi:hypothetical protein